VAKKYDSNGIRTRVADVRGQRPRPLDDGAIPTGLKQLVRQHILLGRGEQG
jgi:hypothetical protein